LQKRYNKSNSVKDSGWNELITPKTFKDYIGQESIKNELQTMLNANRVHGISVQHCLFSGGFGLGKTSVAKIFADMIGNYSFVVGGNIKDKDDFPTTPVVVVDEIHTMKNEEWLLGIMDAGRQTILGTTTTAGSLSGPLRSRFVSLVLEPYNVDELQRMVNGAAKNLRYSCPSFVSKEVAQRGKCIARVALFLFKRVYDRAILNKQVTPAILKQWFEDMKIDPDGLDNADRAYLNCLSTTPAGIQYLTAMTGLDRITLEEMVEPYLLNKGFVKRTPRGRVLGSREVAKVW